MRDWRRRVDPSFYHKEPHLLRAQAHVARYTDDAQAEARLSVLVADPVLRASTALVALAAYVAATGAGAIGSRGEWAAVWALAVLAVATPSALPWWPRTSTRASWLPAAIACVLIAVPAIGARIDPMPFGLALLGGAALVAARGRIRIGFLVAAVGVLAGMRVPAHSFLLAPVAGALAAGTAAAVVAAIALVWRRRPQVATWSALAALFAACAYAFAFDAPAVALRVPGELAALVVAYLGVFVIATRVRRAELLATPGGVLSLPQSIVPLLDRSHHHAVICRLT